MVLFPSNIFKKLKINIEIDTGLSFSQDVSSSGILSSLSGMPACERPAYRGYHEGLSFIRNETRKTGKEKGEKITLIYRVFFWDLNCGIRCVASRLVTRDPDRELAGRGKVHCVELWLRRLALRCQIFPKLAQESLLPGYSKSRRYDK